MYRFLSLRSATSILALSAGLMIPSLAQAQLDEIVVTAQKREQNLQDVPIAVTAVDKVYIESRNITSIKSLSSLAPNVKIENTPGNTTGAQISIRGGVTINPALTWEPTVGMYLNGSYIGKTQGSVFDVADIERIEVLRGPQGTLYGRNTLAGAINIVTARPTEDANGKLKVGFGNYNAKLAKGTVNFGQLGPVRAKVSALYEERDGFIDVVPNPLPGVFAAGPSTVTELDNADKLSFMVALAADLSENLTLDYTYDYSQADQNPVFSQIVSVGQGNIFDPASPFYLGFPGAPGQYFGFPLDLYTNADRQFTASIDGPVFEKSFVSGHNFTATLDTDIGEVKSITSIRDMSWKDSLDLDGSPLPLAHTERQSDYDSFSQELQLAGESGDIAYVVGGYYFSDKGYTINPQTFFGNASIFDSQYGFETDAIAAFANVDFAIADNLTVSGGLRYTEEEKTIDRTNIAVRFMGLPNFTPFVPAGTTGETKFDDLSPQVSVNFEASDQVNLYAKYAQGFKSGGFNGEAGSVAETLRPYNSEKVDSFEIGAKTMLADNRLMFNATAFFNKHRDMQLSVFTAQGAAASDIRNAGSAEIKGLEFETMFQATDTFTLRGTLGLLDPEYKEFIEFGTDVKDDRAFPHAPKTTFSAGFDWEVMQDDRGTVTLTGDANHSSKYFTFPYSLTPTAPQQAFNTEADARTLFDARIAWSDIPVADQDVELALWVKNLGDEEYLANFIDFGPGFGSLTNGYFGPPRTYGATLGISFD
ncbi:MAG: TonB-dependent receptor [Hellea sp.]|nr:TonB-dependent receptor [Hellea sp.]